MLKIIWVKQWIDTSVFHFPNFFKCILPDLSLGLSSLLPSGMEPNPYLYRKTFFSRLLLLWHLILCPVTSLFVTQHSFFLAGMKPNPSYWKKKPVHWWYTAMTPNLSSCVIPLWDSVYIVAILYGTKPFLWLEELNFSGYCQNILFHMFSLYVMSIHVFKCDLCSKRPPQSKYIIW